MGVARSHYRQVSQVSAVSRLFVVWFSTLRWGLADYLIYLYQCLSDKNPNALSFILDRCVFRFFPRIKLTAGDGENLFGVELRSWAILCKLKARNGQRSGGLSGKEKS